MVMVGPTTHIWQVTVEQTVNAVSRLHQTPPRKDFTASASQLGKAWFSESLWLDIMNALTDSA